MSQFLYLTDLFGVLVFAITGALMAGRKSMDLFGVLVIAVVTALGGGTLRDLLLDRHPISWIRDETYLVVAMVGALGTVAWVRLTRDIHERSLLLADAFGLSVFTVIGTEIALQHDVSAGAAVIMGIMTGVAGGVIRDMICNEIPLIFQREIYATACLVGSLVFLMLHGLGVARWLDTTVAMATVLAIRLAALRWHLSLPRFHLLDR